MVTDDVLYYQMDLLLAKISTLTAVAFESTYAACPKAAVALELSKFEGLQGARC